MSINYKDSPVVKKKSKEVKEKKEVKLGHPPSEGLDQMPSYAWAYSKLSGTENASYEYKDSNNKTCFYVRRYEPHEEGNESSKKRIVPYSYDLLTATWVQKGWTKDRPLFRESRLSKNKVVIIPEGEKAVLEAEKIFKDHDCVTWSGGSKAVSRTTFEALKGKKVILFPDNDKVGLEAMHEVAKTLIEEGITEDVHMVEIPEELPEGWDLADHINSKTGITTQGILDSHKEYDPDEHEKIWKKINTRTEKKTIENKVENFLGMYIYIRSLTSFYELKSNEIITKEMLNDWNMEFTKKGDLMSKILLRESGLTKVYSVMTHAGLPSGECFVKPGEFEGINPGKYYNLYKPSHIVSKPGNVEALIEYYRWFIGKNWKIVEQFIAMMIQHPGVKIRWACVFTSVEGGGKGLLASLVSALLGHHNCNTQLNFDQMVSKHSNVLLGLQFGVINELDLSSKKNIKSNTNQLKKIISDPILTIELKNKPQIKIPNFANFFIYSNDDDCLYLTKEARRYFITTIKHEQVMIEQRLEEEGYKDLIVDALEYNSDQLCYLKDYFENVVIEDHKMFQKNAPKTEDFYDLVEKSRQGIHRTLDDRFYSNQYPFESNGEWSTTVDNPNKASSMKNGVCTQPTHTSANYCFSGLVISEELLAICRLDKLLSKEHITRDLIIQWCKEKSIPWKRTGKDGVAYETDQKQISMTGKLTNKLDDLQMYTHARKRVHPKAYLLTDFVVDGQKLSTMTEGELGNHHMLHSYHRMIMDYSVTRNQQEIREEDLPLVPNIDKPSIC